MNKLRGFAAAAVIAGVTLVAGCSGSDTASQAGSGTTGASPSGSPSASAGAAEAAGPFGPSCPKLPASGPGSAASLASAPVATAPLPEDATEVAAEPAPADSPNTADNSEQSKQLGADARGLPARRAAKKTAPSADAARPASAMPYDKATLAQALSAVLQKAEQCDLWGRATGTAKLFVTFAPTGRVTDASLVGEPLQSAAVARCILHHARAASLPPFAGPAFTISRKITLR